jgi:hypothetical protein
VPDESALFLHSEKGEIRLLLLMVLVFDHNIPNPQKEFNKPSSSGLCVIKERNKEKSYPWSPVKLSLRSHFSNCAFAVDK